VTFFRSPPSAIRFCAAPSGESPRREEAGRFRPGGQLDSILHPVARTCRVERLDRRNRLARREATADILQRFCYNAPRLDRTF
jgi:hypothetical protein